MPILSTPRIWGKNFKFMWKNTSRPIKRWLNALEKLSKFSKCLCSCISSEFERLQAWISIVATASSQSKWCAASCYKEEEQNLFTNILDRGKNDLDYRKIPRSHWLERCVCTISPTHRTDWYLSRSACWTTRQISQSGTSTWYTRKPARHAVDKMTRIPWNEISNNWGVMTIGTRNGYCTYSNKRQRATECQTRSWNARVPGMAKHDLGTVLHKRTRTPNLIILFSVVFYILVEHTLVVFELERMATTQLTGWQVVRPEVIDRSDKWSQTWPQETESIWLQESYSPQDPQELTTILIVFSSCISASTTLTILKEIQMDLERKKIYADQLPVYAQRHQINFGRTLCIKR